MDEKKEVSIPGAPEQNTRRDFIKTAGQVAVTAPAVALLLSATTKTAMAQQYLPGFGQVDDATGTVPFDCQTGGTFLDATQPCL